MESKLTLRLDQELVERAKDEARKRGTSVSKMVAAYFRALSSSREKGNSHLPPTTSLLLGSLKGHNVDREAYREHLKDKYR